MKVAVVTGASGGMGRAIAVMFATKGYAVSICARSGDELAKTKKECVAAGLPEKKVVITIGDLTEKKTAEELVRNTIDQLGSIDVLVNNAGFAVLSNAFTSTPEKFDQQFNLNVRSVIQLTGLALPHLVKSKGAIVNISTSGSIVPIPGSMLYCMSKAALDMYTKCLSAELASKNVRVNSVNPGLVETNFAMASGLTSQETKDATYKKMGAVNNPMGRVGHPEEIARTVYFLSSPESSFTTGAIVNVDGGRLWSK